MMASKTSVGFFTGDGGGGGWCDVFREERNRQEFGIQHKWR